MNEQLCFYYMALSAGFVSFDAYKTWLDSMFLSREEDILLELESATTDRNETIKILYLYLCENPVDYTNVLKMILQRINPNDISPALLKMLYELWKFFPEEVAYESPFHALDYLEEIYEMGGKESAKEELLTMMEKVGVAYVE